MAKAGSSKTGEQPTTPKEFAETTPVQAGADVSPWLLSAITKNTESLGELRGTMGGLQSQMTGLEKKIDKIHEDTSKHGKWIAVATAMTLLAVAAFGWLATVLGEVLKEIIKTRMGAP